MSNPLAISPSVMINRLVDQSGTSQNASLLKVAELRMHLKNAVDDEQFKAAQLSPTGEADALPLTSGAVVDRLI